MFDHQALASGLHNFVHPLPYVFRSFAAILDREFNPSLDLFKACPHVLFARGGRLLDQRQTVEIQQVKNFN